MALTDTLHIETVSADKRHVEATMPIVPEVFQPHGYLHGGSIALEPNEPRGTVVVVTLPANASKRVDSL